MSSRDRKTVCPLGHGLFRSEVSSFLPGGVWFQRGNMGALKSWRRLSECPLKFAGVFGRLTCRRAPFPSRYLFGANSRRAGKPVLLPTFLLAETAGRDIL